MLSTPPLSWTISLRAIAAAPAGAATRGHVRRLRRAGRSRRDGLEFPPDDQVDDLLDVGLADEPLGDVAALVQHHDAVADHEQVLQPVGDENDADAVRAHRLG